MLFSFDNLIHYFWDLCFEAPLYSGVTLTTLGKPTVFERIFTVNVTTNNAKAKDIGVTVQYEEELTVPYLLEGLRKNYFSAS